MINKKFSFLHYFIDFLFPVGLSIFGPTIFLDNIHTWTWFISKPQNCELKGNVY